MGRIEKIPGGLVYPMTNGLATYRFISRYAKQKEMPLVNAIIEGKDGDGRALRLTVDDRLCPFATTGIIMIAVGAILFSNQGDLKP